MDAEDFWAMGKQQKKIDARLTRRLNGHFRAVKEMEQKRALVAPTLSGTETSK